ncbi:MAG: bifunctional riboflavin kinase/FAD synthetase [Alphaproteobacteria bacterium]
MDIYKTLSAIPATAKNAVIVIGNFDGVHRGHQEILKRAKSIADDLGKPLGVLTFEPHPRRLFRPDDPPFRITPESLKAERLQNSGVDILFSLQFNWDFASQSAEDFIQKIIKDGLAPAHIIVGYDFYFGQLRKGQPKDFAAAGIETTIIEEIAEHDEKLSSSRIRAALRHGKILEANALLGWDWEIRGEVIGGDQRGRELGYPTANVALGNTAHPAYGVYATLARIEGETEWRASATNIGIRPMFEAPEALVETYIFDFDEQIYGKTLHIKPIERLRGEAKFDSLDDLITQIEKDCEQARAILS